MAIIPSHSAGAAAVLRDIDSHTNPPIMTAPKTSTCLRAK